MGWFSELFDSTSETESTSASRRDPYSGAQPYFDDMIGYAGEQGMVKQTPYGAPNFLSMDPAQRGALQGQQGVAGGYDQNVINPMMGAWQSQMAGPDQGVYDNMMKHYSDNVWQNFDRNTMPGIGNLFTDSGNRNSSRRFLSEGVAAGDVGGDIARYGAGLETDYMNQANRMQAGALGQTGNVMNWGMNPGNLQYQTATALRGDEQNALNQDMYNDQFTQNQGVWGNFNQAFPNVFNAASTFGEQSGEAYSSTTSNQGIGNTLLNAAGQAAMAYATGGMGGGGGAPVPGGGGNIGTYNQMPNSGYQGGYGYSMGQPYAAGPNWGVGAV